MNKVKDLRHGGKIYNVHNGKQMLMNVPERFREWIKENCKDDMLEIIGKPTYPKPKEVKK